MRVAVIPGALALLPKYAARTDPVPDLRAACQRAVDWLGEAPRVVADPQGAQVATSLVRSADSATQRANSAVIVLNGSARRTKESPGPYDPRAMPFDDELRRALAVPDPDALKALDQDLARELWAATSSAPDLAELLTGDEEVFVDYDEAPYGVQYWVVRYER